MSQFFSFKRFKLTVLKHWADNKKRYSLSVLAFLGLLIAWFLFAMLVPENRGSMNKDIQQITFFFTLFVIGTFYASQFFNDLGSRAKATNLILLPASTFEKLLCSLLYSVLLFLVVFTTSFYLADILMVSIANAFTATDAITPKPTLYNVFKVNLIRFNNNCTINMVLFFLSIQSLFLCGSVYFRKYNFLKTIISAFIAYLILFSLAFFLYRRFIPGGEHPDGPAEVPDWIPQALCFLTYAIAPIFWLITYYRLKQKQV